MSEYDEQLQIALDLVGLKNVIIRQGRTITGPARLLKELEADGAFSEFNRVSPGLNVGRGESPVFHHMRATVDKYGISPAKAKEILSLMRGAFSPIDQIKLIDGAILALNGMINESQTNRLKWIGNTRTLGFLINELVLKGYIAAPETQEDDINDSGLADQIIESFAGKVGAKESLRKAVNPKSDSALSLDKQKRFSIPFLWEISSNKPK